MTDREKQIEEIKDTIDSVYGCDCAYYGVEGFAIAKALYDAGYRKQVDGEWLERKGERWIGSEVCETYTYYNCSICEGYSLRRTNHCPNCGAKMKGGA